MWLEQCLISILNKLWVGFQLKYFLSKWDKDHKDLPLWELIFHDHEISLSQWCCRPSFVIVYEDLQFSGPSPLISVPCYRLSLFVTTPIPFSFPLGHYIMKVYALISICSYHILFIYLLTSLWCPKVELFALQLCFWNSHFHESGPTFGALIIVSKRDPLQIALP